MSNPWFLLPLFYCGSAGLFLAWKTLDALASRTRFPNLPEYHYVTIKSLVTTAFVGILGPVGILIFGLWLIIEVASFPPRGILAKRVW